MIEKEIFTAANWAIPEDNYTQMFYRQNVRQFWLPDEISLNGDLLTWKSLEQEQKDTYRKVLGGLTLLDTEQGNVGMPLIATHVEGHQRKAVLNWMGMMENAVHARSYSHIFLTLASKEEINEVFNWVEENRYLQKKTKMIVDQYRSIRNGDPLSLYRAMAASVFLESFLFYSGFYYPLYWYGQGKLMQSGEIINLIIRDEAIHGVYVGLQAQEIFKAQDPETQKMLEEWTIDFLLNLYDIELLYTADLYDQVGLTSDVKKFVRYNANKALQNLGFDQLFEEEEFNPVVLNGLNTKSKSHDFFSMKGNSYKIAIVEPIKDEDFYFPDDNS